MNRAYLVWDNCGWCLMDAKTKKIICGPHKTIEDLTREATIREYRLSMGWQP